MIKIIYLVVLVSTLDKIVGAYSSNHDLYPLENDLACSATKVIAKTIMNAYKEQKEGPLF